MKVSLVIASLFASALAAPSFTSQYELDGGDRRGGEGSIIDKLRGEKRFSRFVEILDKSRGLRDELEKGQNTVFAPTNEAVDRAEREWKRDEGNRADWSDVARYHVAAGSEIEYKDLHAGLLIPTDLRVKALGDRHQRTRVFRFGDRVWLNMRATVEEEPIEASNGMVFAIDHVLLPPASVTEMVNVLPSRFSTFALALERTGLAREIEREKELTVFAPTNSAWEALGMENNRYLFSCAGQQTEQQSGRVTCAGKKELARIVKNHIGERLVYSTDIMSKRTVKVPTMGKQEVEICAKEEERRNRDDSQHHDVRDYHFMVNKGEARVVFTDMLASNGAIHAINSVLTEGVNLPHDWCEINM